MRWNIILLFIIIFFYSCSDEQIYYKDYFDLYNYNEVEFDLYNPVLNRYQNNKCKLKEDTNYFYKGYFKKGTLLFILCMYESYSYLGKFNYNTKGHLLNISMYPLLNLNYTPGKKILKINYFYKDNELKIIKDEFEDKLIFINGDTLSIYNGLLNTLDYTMQKKLKNEYYIQLLNE